MISTVNEINRLTVLHLAATPTPQPAPKPFPAILPPPQHTNQRLTSRYAIALIYGHPHRWIRLHRRLHQVASASGCIDCSLKKLTQKSAGATWRGLSVTESHT